MLLVLLIGILSFFGWSLRYRELVTSTLTHLSLSLILFMVALLVTNELVKGFRWAWYLRAATLSIGFVNGLTSYLASQAAGVILGGSLLAARLAEEHGQGHIGLRHTTPPLLVQGIGDLIAVALLATIGIILTTKSNYQLLGPAFGLALALLALVTIRSVRVNALLRGILSSWELTRRFVPTEEDAHKVLVTLTYPRALIPGTIFSFLTSLISVYVLVVLSNTLSIHGLSVVEGAYVLSMTMLAHLVLPIPNGFGTNELGLVGFLNLSGIGFGRATAIAVTYRVLGLSLRLLLGLLVLFLRYPHLVVSLNRVSTSPRPVSPALEPTSGGQD